MSELATAVFAAQTEAHLLDAPRSARFAAFRDAFDEPAFLRRARRARATAGSPAATRVSRAAAIDPRPAAGALRPRRGAARRCSSARRSRSSARARARAYGTSVARSLARELAAAGVRRRLAASRAASTARRIAARSRRGRPSPCSAAASTATTRARTRRSPREIARDGLIVSEYPPGVEPAPWRFPARNRIVAGLTLATVVVEARERSGALITADLALEEGREVLAVPGEITSQLSRGTNHLLRLGAAPVDLRGDVLRVARRRSAAGARAAGDSSRGSRGCCAPLADAPATADELALATGSSAAAVAAALAELELPASSRRWTASTGGSRPGVAIAAREHDLVLARRSAHDRLPRSRCEGRAGRRRDRRRRHRLLLRADARASRRARPRPRGARDRGGRERPQRRLRAPRRASRTTTRGASSATSWRGSCGAHRAGTRPAGRAWRATPSVAAGASASPRTTRSASAPRRVRRAA